MTVTIHDDEAPDVDDVDDVLDGLDVVRRIEHETANDRLGIVARVLTVHDAATVDPVAARLPGRQRAVRLGGEGTPPVAEFAPALIGGRLEISAWAADRLCADVLDLVHRLPRIWAGIGDYRLRAPLARLVAGRTRHLSAAQATAVEERVLESCDGRLPWGRFLRVVEAAVAEVDAEAVAAREKEAETEQVAHASRSTEHAMRSFFVRAPFPVIAKLEATVSHVADALEALGHQECLEERRVLAVLVLTDPALAVRLLTAYHQANRDTPDVAPVDDPDAARDPGRSPEVQVDLEKLLPTVVLYLHLTDQMSGVARVEGLETEHEPVTAEWVRRWLGPRCRFTIKPVLTPESLTPVDSYEVPTRHREAVHLISPADCFPWAGSTSRSVQIDHTVPFDPHGPPGQSSIGNYGPMTTKHHRIKTHGGWRCEQPFPGIYLWRDPTGATYLVDHTGTRRLRPA